MNTHVLVTLHVLPLAQEEKTYFLMSRYYSLALAVNDFCKRSCCFMYVSYIYLYNKYMNMQYECLPTWMAGLVSTGLDPGIGPRMAVICVITWSFVVGVIDATVAWWFRWCSDHLATCGEVTSVVIGRLWYTCSILTYGSRVWTTCLCWTNFVPTIQHCVCVCVYSCMYACMFVCMYVYAFDSLEGIRRTLND